MDSTMSHEVIEKFREVDARLDALEALIPGNGATKATEEEASSEEESSPPTRTARGSRS